MSLYLDAAATTPVAQEVAAAMGPHIGRRERPRERAALVLRVARALGAERVELASGATEANGLALRAAVLAGLRGGRRQIVSQPTEHPSVRASIEALAHEHALEVVWLPVDARGLVDPAEAARAIDARTAVVSLMRANHETGVLQPVQAVGALARAAGALLHTDAVQAARHEELQLDALQADLLVVTAHKLDGPRGCGALALGPRAAALAVATPAPPAQALVAGLAAALDRRARLRAKDGPATAAARDALEAALLGVGHGGPSIGEVQVLGAGAPRLPGHLALALAGLSGEALVAWLDLEAGVSASSGAACASGALEPSPVLRALGLPPALARGSLRLSLPGPLRAHEVARVADAVTRGAVHLRSLALPSRTGD